MSKTITVGAIIMAPESMPPQSVENILKEIGEEFTGKLVEHLNKNLLIETVDFRFVDDPDNLENFGCIRTLEAIEPKVLEVLELCEFIEMEEV